MSIGPTEDQWVPTPISLNLWMALINPEEDIAPFKVLLITTGKSEEFLSQWFSSMWHDKKEEISTHRSIMPFLPGVDYLEPRFYDNSIQFHIRLSLWEQERLTIANSFYCMHHEHSESPPPPVQKNENPPWFSGKWFATIISYFIYVIGKQRMEEKKRILEQDALEFT
jgi:hypothetical protein